MRIELRAAGWRTVGSAAARGFAFDDGGVVSAAGIAERFGEAASGGSLGSVAQLAAGLEGFFAVVVHAGETTFVISDRARSVPMYYATDGTVVSDRGAVVRDGIGAETDPIAESEFLLTRYVAGPETVWAGVASIQPGEVVAVDDDGVRRHRYWGYWPAGHGEAPTEPLEELREGFETALDRLQRIADGRPVVVPLSGGHDSRLVAAGLVVRGHDVIAFTFGRSGHPDVEVSREVAARLGVRWEFCPYSAADWAEWYHGDACSRYRRASFGGDALPFLAEWPAVRGLISEGRLPTDALFCPGHTVATPSERLPAFVGGETGPGTAGCEPERVGHEPIEPTVSALVDDVLDRHYSLWEWDDDAFASAAKARVREGLLGDRPADAVSDPETAAAAYERWEWNGRMTTFTNGDLRVYEDVGVEWWLPLWDPAYVRAWERVPLDGRRKKRLHAELAVDYYRRAADVPAGRAALTDRSLSAVDRQLALVRHTPERQFSERGGDWSPPFSAPRPQWGTPGTHPLGWYGAVDPRVLETVPEERGLYALRTLEATGRLDFGDQPEGGECDEPLSLPTDRGGGAPGRGDRES